MNPIYQKIKDTKESINKQIDDLSKTQAEYTATLTEYSIELSLKVNSQEKEIAKLLEELEMRDEALGAITTGYEDALAQLQMTIQAMKEEKANLLNEIDNLLIYNRILINSGRKTLAALCDEQPGFTIFSF